MNYELARRLKDAGFPHKWADDFDISVDRVHPEDCKCLPTLSELIDFVDGSDRMKAVEQEYAEKALLKLQKDKKQ